VKVHNFLLCGELFDVLQVLSVKQKRTDEFIPARPDILLWKDGLLRLSSWVVGRNARGWDPFPGRARKTGPL
jgi:hypothetical protein